MTPLRAAGSSPDGSLGICREDSMGLANELQEALDSINDDGDEVLEELTCEEMSLFLEENPIVIAIADELGGFSEALSFMDEAMEVIGEFPTASQAIRLFEKVHSPFKNKSSLTLDASVIGSPNPRSEVKDCDCTQSGEYKQLCTCKYKTKDGKITTQKRMVDMSDYYSSGNKAKYMKNWREKTAAAGKK
jgi:hypothetical protein